MSYKAIILPLAKEDVREAAHWYNKRQEGLGKQFSATVRKKVRTICDNPDAYAVRYNVTHVALMDVIPYLIHFIVDPIDKKVIVTAVLHTRQSPENWNRAIM